MTRSSPETPAPVHRWSLLLALGVGLTGLYPHLRWSHAMGHLSWFFNSYDEGYYGWLSLTEFSFNRVLSDLAMHVLAWTTGGNFQAAMVLADFVLPFSSTLACCYLVQPIFRTASARAAGVLTILFSAECLALRSSSVPYANLQRLIADLIPQWAGGREGIALFENQTSTFWLFRTPEPQVSWIVLFLTLGFVLRVVNSPDRIHAKRGWLLGLALLAGSGYLFCALALGGALLLFGVLAAPTRRHLAWLVGGTGALITLTCLGLSFLAARHASGESLVFASRRPVLTLGILLGLLATVIVFVRQRGHGPLSPAHWFAIALGLTPVVLANQQLLTGRMIYLLNFENFSLAQFSALALLLACRPGIPEAGPAPRLPWVAGGVLAVIGSILINSQIASYRDYSATNRIAESYTRVLATLRTDHALVVCDDFFETDTLAVRLGRRPPLLLARDTIFTHPIPRLRNAGDRPEAGRAARQALFAYLALTGTTPDNLDERLVAITDLDNPNWQDRLMLGAFLYNHADFWAPLTHHRDDKTAWIRLQRPEVVAEYREFLSARKPLAQPVIFIMQRDKPTPEFVLAQNGREVDLAIATPIALKAYRLGGTDRKP